MLTYGSLFSGVGGFDLGFDRAGMVCKWQVEKDSHCRHVLTNHWPNVPKYEDVNNVGQKQLQPVDLICGGFPCQDVSVAGRRKGLAGERSGLWFEFLRIITEIKPEWVVIENVPGLLSSNEGRDFATILGGLEECGYWWSYRVLDSQYFGVPQRRRRVFIIGCLTRGRAEQVLFEPEGSPWDIAPSRETWPQITDTVGTSADRISGRQGGLVPLAYGGNNTKGPISIATSCNGNVPSSRGENLVTNAFNGYTGGADDNDAQASHIVIGFDARNGSADPNTFQSYQGVGVRRLTPTECERLQGFPDGHTAGQSDTQRYRQMGNAVTVPVAEWLGKRLIEADK